MTCPLTVPLKAEKEITAGSPGAIAAASAGETPVATQFGYHLIKLNAKNEASVIPYEQIADQLKEMLVGEKRREAYERKINQLKLLYPVDLV